VLNELHALIRVPFKLLRNYCADYDHAAPGRMMMNELRATDWYDYARAIRNTVSHNLSFDFSKYKMEKFPITWRDVSLTAELHGKVITFESFWHNSDYEPFVTMRSFAEVLPELEA
jgi:hypothetical protein